MTLKDRVTQLTFHIQNYNERIDVLLNELSRMENALHGAELDLDRTKYDIEEE